MKHACCKSYVISAFNRLVHSLFNFPNLFIVLPELLNVKFILLICLRFWVALHRADVRMVRWMCSVKVKHRVPSKELRERLGIDDIILILQKNRLWWYGHVLQKEDTDWVKKCMEYEVEGSRPRGKRTCREVVQKDCQARNLNREDAMDCGRWKKLIKIGWWSGWWVGECFFWYRLTRVVPDKGP